MDTNATAKYMKVYRPSWVEVNLENLKHNCRTVKQLVGENVKIAAVVKANGYGHGAVQIAEMLESVDYIWGFAVATLDEAVVLRSEGIKKPILVLGCVFPDQYMAMLKHDIRMNVYTEEMAESISQMAAREGMTAYMHI